MFSLHSIRSLRNKSTKTALLTSYHHRPLLNPMMTIIARNDKLADVTPVNAVRSIRNDAASISTTGGSSSGVKLSSLLQKHLGLSRRQSERMILTERITLYGTAVKNPAFELPSQDDRIAVKVDGRLMQGAGDTLRLLQNEMDRTKARDAAAEDHDSTQTSSNTAQTTRHSNTQQSPHNTTTRVWLCNKLKGELITEDDPDGRPSMIRRLVRGGVGEINKKNKLPTHLKPVGRLDMMTEGLMIVTDDGKYARSLELPANRLWRTYRVRVHGRLTVGKLNAMRRGVTVKLDDNDAKEDRHASGEVVKTTTGKTMKYKGIKVSVERRSAAKSRKRRGGGIGSQSSHSGGTNAWLQITCTEGKNRMLRRTLSSMGLDVTRLIRISYGDYDLNTIPPGRAVEVPCKRLEKMRRTGPVFASGGDENSSEKDNNRRGKTYNDSTAASDRTTQNNRIEWISYS